MRALSFVIYYLSFLLGFYAVFSVALKVSSYGGRFFAHSLTEFLVLAFAIALLIISKMIKPKIKRDENGRTITKNL